MTLGWGYSRTWRSHYLDDGRRYKESYLSMIKAAVPLGTIHRYEHGYDLFVKGKFIKNAKTVKELKGLAEKMLEDKQCE